MEKDKEEKNKKALSPIIATVLLILLVVVIAIIILLWSYAFISETIMKNNKNIDLVCRDVILDGISNDDGTLGFTNIGNIALYGYRLKTSDKGIGRSRESEFVGENDRVNPGESRMIYGSAGEFDKVEVYPILIGTSKQNKGGTGKIKQKTCINNPIVIYEHYAN